MNSCRPISTAPDASCPASAHACQKYRPSNLSFKMMANRIATDPAPSYGACPRPFPVRRRCEISLLIASEIHFRATWTTTLRGGRCILRRRNPDRNLRRRRFVPERWHRRLPQGRHQIYLRWKRRTSGRCRVPKTVVSFGVNPPRPYSGWHGPSSSHRARCRRISTSRRRARTTSIGPRRPAALRSRRPRPFRPRRHRQRRRRRHVRMVSLKREHCAASLTSAARDHFLSALAHPS